MDHRHAGNDQAARDGRRTDSQRRRPRAGGRLAHGVGSRRHDVGGGTRRRPDAPHRGRWRQGDHRALSVRTQDRGIAASRLRRSSREHLGRAARRRSAARIQKLHSQSSSARRAHQRRRPGDSRDDGRFRLGGDGPQPESIHRRAAGRVSRWRRRAPSTWTRRASSGSPPCTASDASRTAASLSSISRRMSGGRRS